MLVWLDDASPFPDPATALPDGLVAVGGDLSLARLRDAYTRGIFPWYNEGDPILWWSPDPRMVLACADFQASHSLRKLMRQVARTETAPDATVQIKTDTAFEQVMRACSQPRAMQTGTWISPAIRAAYLAWHEAGQAHSIETWIDGRLEGGLYGVALGRFFFGESMFHQTRDASKLALAYLVAFLMRRGITHIDCQQQTGHLASLGARPMARDRFRALLDASTSLPAPAWPAGRLAQSGLLASDTLPPS
ncbi:MAG TPA: leucyl/phenylalanyl-tRNA--protein transferase [Burkholderiaceae bacterium]|nr:leucyl/phenylalanyl-tRNA--protein transferase [Burkholderiaceae bacterium]